MLECETLPKLYECVEQAGLEAIVPALEKGQDAICCCTLDSGYVARFFWSPLEVGDYPEEGIIRPSALKDTDPGRWVYIGCLQCG